jgi:hypothetical protein
MMLSLPHRHGGDSYFVRLATGMLVNDQGSKDWRVIPCKTLVLPLPLWFSWP